jgi:hypothetical protein
LNEEPETDVVAHEQVSRPVLFVCGDNIKAGQALPSKWISSGGVIDERIRVTIRSVGRISRISSPSSSSDRGRDALTPLATGFVIAERMVIVPGALEELRRLDPDSSLVIEFDRSACLEQPIDPKISQRFDLEHVEHQSDPNRSPQWSLYRIRTHGSEVPPTPLSLIAKKPDRDLTDTRIAVIGHPFPDSRHPESVVARCFPPPFGVKRIAFGLIKRNQNDEFGPELWHDCSTSAGDMGAPIIDLTTGKVLGIHIGGTYLKGNQAAPMWNVLTATELQDIPEIQALLDSGR